MKPGVFLPGRGMLSHGLLESRRAHEMKCTDQAIGVILSQTEAGAATPTVLFFNQQGTGNHNRVGMKIGYVSLRLTGFICPSQGVGALTQNQNGCGRLLVVYDASPQQAAAIYSDVVLAVGFNATTQSKTRDGINLANRERFKVLMDERLFLPAFTFGATTRYDNKATFPAVDKNPTMYNFDRYVKLRGLDAHFNNTNGGTVADFTKGTLLMFFIGDGAASTNWQFDCNSRVRYIDY